MYAGETAAATLGGTPTLGQFRDRIMGLTGQVTDCVESLRRSADFTFGEQPPQPEDPSNGMKSDREPTMDQLLRGLEQQINRLQGQVNRF